MKFLSVVGILALLIIGGLLSANHSFGQAQGVSASDFETAIQAGLHSLAINPGARLGQQQIQSQDYKSTWDEFGISMLIDGTTPPAEVDRKIIEDIIQAVQTETNYNQQETKYLGNIQITPEEIQVMEESGGSDVPPGEFIDPNPSVEANPDVNMSTSEDQGQNNVEESTSTENTSALQTTSTAETGTSTSEVSTSSDETIFDAILQGELVNPSIEPTPPPPEPPPAE